MTILEQMKENDELKMLLATGDKRIQDAIKLKGLAMKPKRPRVNKILGEANPFNSEELEALKEFAKISRETN